MIRTMTLMALLIATPALAEEAPCSGDMNMKAQCQSERAQAAIQAAYEAKLARLDPDQQTMLKLEQSMWKPQALQDCMHEAGDKQLPHGLIQKAVHECMTARAEKRRAQLVK
ncbi:MAG: lysozyme inhibitor LprI family protein [Rickettsiales bacterium]